MNHQVKHMNEMKLYKQWCEDPYFDPETRQELTALAGNEKEITERFYRPLAFGTGGMRGLLGAGINRMNRYTVRQATQGLADYIIARQGQKKGVAIAYDSRHMSPQFAEEAALCLNGNGIKTYLFDALRPTPELSFAVRRLGCIAGIVITASHNPREYNGYKVYWEDGAQITAPHDQEIMAAVAAVTDYAQIKMINQKEAVSQGLYQIIGAAIDDAFMAELKKQSLHPELVTTAAKNIRIVYTPLHGAGNLPVRRVLKELGFEQVYIVTEQEQPDGDFPTVTSPNPEEEGAWELALKLAKEVKADIVLATDPDADRLGLYARDKDTGEYVRFNGNMSGMLIAEYILRERTKLGLMPEFPAVVKTIVTTNMIRPLAAEYKTNLIEVLTGFKYIGEQIRLFEEQQNGHFLFGMEESYGCLAGTYARDKDACVAVMMLCEAAAYYQSLGITLCEAMQAMYQRYGYYQEGLSTLTRDGADGAAQISAIMAGLRSAPPVSVGGFKVLAGRDYLSGLQWGLPKSDVLYYELEDDGWCCVRPSGTEPKIKFYCGVKGHSYEDSVKRLELLSSALLNI